MAKLCQNFCPMGVTQLEQKSKAPVEIIIVPLWLARCLLIPLFKQMHWSWRRQTCLFWKKNTRVAPKACSYWFRQQFRCLFEEGNQAVKCLTCSSSGARHAGVFGHRDLSVGDRGQGWGSGGSRPVLIGGQVWAGFFLGGHIQPRKKRQFPHSDKG